MKKARNTWVNLLRCRFGQGQAMQDLLALTTEHRAVDKVVQYLFMLSYSAASHVSYGNAPRRRIVFLVITMFCTVVQAVVGACRSQWRSSTCVDWEVLVRRH